MTASALLLVACLTLAISSSTQAATSIDEAYAQLIAVEREFAADAQVMGVTKAFRKYIAPNGVLFRPDPVLGSAALADQEDAEGVALDWWPAFAGLAQSADLGFNFGPFQVLPANRYGFFLTVWGKQPGGEWKFLIDRGPRPEGVPVFKKDGPVGRLPVYSGGAIPDRATALENVRDLENVMTVELQSDVKATFLKHLADDAWVVGSKSQPEQGRAFFLGELDRRPKAAFQQPVGGAQSKAGDLVYTYGLMTWADDKGTTVPGHYLRVWQRRGDTWKIVADELVPPAAPPRSPPARPSE
jgi:ketosteroid isomerase-like protein